jgi:arylsulfatase A-like enzyme
MADQRPNVLWICTDQQRYDAVGCYGNDHVETPNVDALADHGVRFDRAYCQNPVCTPSRASMLTGRYPRTTRCRQNGQPIPDAEQLLPALLSEAGYTTGLAGKLHLSPTDRNAPPSLREPIRALDDGYQVTDWSHNKRSHPANGYRQWLREQGRTYEATDRPESEYVREGMPPEYHQTTWCADRACDFMRTNRDEPWLFSVNIFDPHPPFYAPEGYLDAYDIQEVPLPNYEAGELEDKPAHQHDKHVGDNARGGPPYVELDPQDHRAIRAAYWAMCDLVDEAVGEMVNTLSETGQRDNTLVVFTSDHGTMLGDHGLYRKGPYFYDPAVRVPLIVDGPGVTDDTVGDIVELVDLAPTVLEATGVDPSPGIQGESLWPLLRGNDGEREKSTAYCESYNASTQHADPEVYATMVRTDRHKLVNVHGRDEGELYDLERDPLERTNRWSDPDYAAVRSRLLVRLSDRMAETVDPLPERVGVW